MTRYLEQLNNCTDPVAGDYFPIYDASAGATDKDRKVDVGIFAQKTSDNVFTTVQTINGFAIGGSAAPTLGHIASGHERLLCTTMSLTNGSVYSYAISALSFVFVYNATSGTGGIFQFRGGFNIVNSVYMSANFSTTAGTATSVNVYYSSGYKIQNNVGSTISLWIFTISA